MGNRPRFHKVVAGDTLHKISQTYGISIEELKKINSINNPNLIKIGQLIALSKEAVCKVEAQFFDKLGRPIGNLNYRITSMDNIISGATPNHGRTCAIITDSPKDKVSIEIKNIAGQWVKVHNTVSGFGNKIVNIISNEIHVIGKIFTETKDKVQHFLHLDSEGKQQSGGPKNNKKNKPKKGHMVSVSSDDLPDELKNWFKEYSGDLITEDDYNNAANELGIEVAAVKAFAEVESSGSGFDDQNRPKILYERHKFSKHTDKIYNDLHPDLSSKSPYRMTKTHDINSYGGAQIQYGKLARSCRLDKSAAYQSCSWGAFQIMGESYGECGFSDIESFVKAMCISERQHLDAFIKFCKHKSGLIAALKKYDWETVAKKYNGPGYAKGDYHNKLQKAYQKHSK